MWRFALAVLAALCGSAQAAEPNMPVGVNTASPLAFPDFCSRHPRDCAPTPVRTKRVHLTSKEFATLDRVNRLVNKTIQPASDKELYGKLDHWTYPAGGKGDCEDLAILKKDLLRREGFPVETLLITIVWFKTQYHAVLTVVTDRGDMVLDNQHDEIRVWHNTGYLFKKRQSQEDPSQWVSLIAASIAAMR